MIKAIIFLLLLTFSISSFSSTLSIHFNNKNESILNKTILKTSISDGYLRIVGERRHVCLVDTETAQNAGYSFGHLQILSYENTEIICRTNGDNLYGDYIANSIEVKTKH